MIAAHSWSTDLVILSSGSAYYSSLSLSAGTLFDSNNYLVSSGGGYSAGICQGQVLIIYSLGTYPSLSPSPSLAPAPVSEPVFPSNAVVTYDGNTYSTLSGVPVDGKAQLCQASSISLPGSVTCT